VDARGSSAVEGRAGTEGRARAGAGRQKPGFRAREPTASVQAGPPGPPRLAALQAPSPSSGAVHRIATLETFGPSVPSRTLVIVSDLLEHSSLGSAYRGMLSVERLNGSVYLER